jgi:hypothetical protein
VEYFDSTYFSDITISDVPPIRTGRATIGVWVYIDKPQTLSKVFHISLSDLFVLSFVTTTGSTDLDVYCFVNQMYHSTFPTDIQTTTTKGAFTTALTNYTGINITKTITNMARRWFYARCAVDYESNVYYVAEDHNKGDPYQTGSKNMYTTGIIPTDKLFNGQNIYSDIRFRKFYKSTDLTYLKLVNVHNFGTPVFFKNLNVFNEFIPYTITGLQYYYLHTILATGDMPEYILTIPFGEDFDYTNFKINYYINPSKTATKTQLTLTPNANSPAVYSFPENFYRLTLLSTANTKFSTRDTDPSLTTTFTCTTGLYCFDTNLAFVCPSNQYLDINSLTCAASCPANYQLGDGVTATKGYCVIYRNPAIYTGLTLTSFTCAAGYTMIYTDCIKTPDGQNFNNADYRGALYFSSFYQLPYLNIDVPGMNASFNLNYYYLEFWWMYETNSLLRPTNAKNYIFYSTGARIYHNSGATTFNMEDCNGNNIASNFASNLTLYYWNKFTLKVVKNGANADGYLYINNDFSAPAASYTNQANCKLTYITWCHADPTCPNGIGSINWSSGWYRNVRAWDATTYYINDNMIWQYAVYDNYYYNYIIKNNYNPFFYRPKYMAFHFPFNLSNLNNNILKDPIDGYTVNLNTPHIAINPSNLRLYNVSTDFDIPQMNQNTNKYMDSTGSSVTCTVGCTSCFTSGSSSCTTCTTTGYYYKYKTCTAFPDAYKGYWVYPSPPLNNANLTFSAITYGTKITISFFVKILGFQDVVTSDIIRFGSNLLLRYDHATDKMNLLRNDTGVIFATVNTFKNYFGQYVYISLAYQYDATKAFYYPAIMNFTVDNVNLTITNYANLSGLDLSNIVIPNSVFGLFARLWVHSDFLIGAWGYDTNKWYWTNTPTEATAKVLIDETSSTCVNGANISAPATTNIICYIDYDVAHDKTNYVNKIYTPPGITNSDLFKVAAGVASTAQCSNTLPDLCYETCYTTTACSCRSNSYNYMLFKNSNAHKCYIFDYIEFVRLQPVTFNSIKVNKTGAAYTLEFWFYSYVYNQGNVTNNFTYELRWDYQLRMAITQNAGALKVLCYPAYDPTNVGGYNTTGSVGFNNYTWTYVRCSADQIKKQFMIVDATSRTKAAFTAFPAIPSSTGTFTMKDSTAYDSWGVLFFRQIRLWKCYNCMNPSLYKTEIITTTAGYGNLLHVFDPYFNTSESVTELATNTKVTGSFRNNYYGYNIIDENNYSLKTLCSEFNPCLSLGKTNQFDDIVIDDIPVSYWGRYTVEFWTYAKDSTQMTNGFNVIYGKHAAVSIQADTNTNDMLIYCFPQDYRYSPKGKNGPAIKTLASGLTNSSSYKISGASKQWFWVRCAVSWDNREFYINDDTPTTLLGELLWTGQNNDFPFRYFWPNNSFTDLTIEGAKNNNTDVYIRALSIFNDYLPNNYLFKNLLLNNLTPAKFPNLIFSIDMTNWDISSGDMDYTTPSGTNTYTATAASGIVPDIDNTLIIESMCDPTGMKYVAGFGCKPYTSCNLPALNALVCANDNEPLTCTTGFYLNPGSPNACTNACTTLNRSPCSDQMSAICNFNCSTNHNVCLGLSDVQMHNYSNTVSCNANFDRISYECIDDTKQKDSATLYNNCYNFQSVYNTFSQSFNQLTQKGYYLEFWFKMDNINTYCTAPPATQKNYIFYSYPHTFWHLTGQTKMHYENLLDPTSLTGQFDFHQYEWNKFIMLVDMPSSGQSITIWSNLHFDTPALTFPTISSNLNQNILGIGFCNGDCDPGSIGKQTVNWSSAYYKNIRIYDSSYINQFVIQAYMLGQFNAMPKALLLYYTLQAKDGDLNLLKNSIVANGEDIDYSTIYTTGDLSNSDKCMLFNFSDNNFDWHLTNTSKSVTGVDTVTGAISSIGCSTNCKYCYSISPKDCHECKPNYVLYYSECKSANGNFLSVPVGSGKTVPLNLVGNGFDVRKTNGVTLTFWFKYYGTVVTSTNACPTIVSFSKTTDTFLCVDAITNELKFYYQTSNQVFESADLIVRLGQWTLVSLSNYYSSGTIYKYFPTMVNFWLQTEDQKKEVNFNMPGAGLNIDNIDIGNEIIALFADMRFYNNYIVQPYGLVMSLDTTNQQDMMFNRYMIGTTSKNCLTDSDIDGGNAGSYKISCVPDYHPYLDTTLRCTNPSVNFFNITAAGDCNGLCDATCTNNNLFCSTTKNIGCTCDYKTKNWLRMDKNVSQVYCDTPPYFDFARSNVTYIPGTASSHNDEYTMEFMYYVYSYNENTKAFTSFDIIWDNHIKATFYNENNLLKLKCYPVYRSNQPTSSTQFSTDATTPKYYTWNYAQCSTSLNSMKFYINQLSEQTLFGKIQKITNMTDLTSSLTLQPSAGAGTSYGFLFIRDIKLWSTYNLRQFFTKCHPDKPQLLTNLLHYFMNDSPSSYIHDYTLPVNGTATNRTDWIGYNIIDPNNNYDIEKIPYKLDNCPYLITNPTQGFFAATNFLFECYPPTDTGAYTYKFSYSLSTPSITGEQPKYTINDFSSQSEVTYAFTSMNLFKSTNNLNIYCDIKDSQGKIYTAYQKITVYLNSAINDFTFDKYSIGIDLNKTFSETELLNRAKTLGSLASNYYQQIASANMTELLPTVDKSVLLLQDPQCQDQFCNKQGSCYLIDKYLTCICKNGYTGLNCQLNNENAGYLVQQYQSLWGQLTYNGDYSQLGSNITRTRLDAVSWLLSGAAKFISDESFFTQYYQLLSYVTTYNPNSFEQNYDILFENMNSLILYYLNKINNVRIMNSSNYTNREIYLSQGQQSQFVTPFNNITSTIKNIVNKYIRTLAITGSNGNNQDIRLNYFTYHVYAIQISNPETYDFNSLFKARDDGYNGFFDPKGCLSVIKNSQISQKENSFDNSNGNLSLDTSKLWMIMIYYRINPFLYSDYYTNSSTFLTNYYFTDNNGNTLDVENCKNQITMYLPLYIYDQEKISYINENKKKFDPNNYVPWDDPLFTAPRYVYKNGSISNFTQEERINLYHRFYNYTCDYLDLTTGEFTQTGLTYFNYTNNYIACNTTHLSTFGVSLIDNPPTYLSDGRFYYLKVPQIFLCGCNYVANSCLWLIAGFGCVYLLLLIILVCIDYYAFKKEVLIDFIKMQILSDENRYLSKRELNNELLKVNMIFNKSESNAININGGGGIFTTKGQYPFDVAAAMLNPSEKLATGLPPIDIIKPGKVIELEKMDICVSKEAENKEQQTAKHDMLFLNRPYPKDSGAPRSENNQSALSWRDDSKKDDLVSLDGILRDSAATGERLNNNYVDHNKDNTNNNGDRRYSFSFLNENVPIEHEPEQSNHENAADKTNMFPEGNVSNGIYASPPYSESSHMKQHSHINNNMPEGVVFNNFAHRGSLPGGHFTIENNKEIDTDKYLDHEPEDDFYGEPSFCKFFLFGIVYRHVYIGPIAKRNLFNPRYKRMTLLFTYLCLIMLMLALFFTSDENVDIVIYLLTLGLSKW